MLRGCLACLLLGLIAACAQSQSTTTGIDDFLQQPWELSPRKIQVDFDGDSIADRILVAGLKGQVADLQKLNPLIHPWPYAGKVQQNLAHGSKRSFHIVLSANNRGYVIRDANPISLLDTHAARELFVLTGDQSTAAGLKTQSPKPRGDLLIIPTEAGIDTYLYWDGDTFKSHEPLELP